MTTARNDRNTVQFGPSRTPQSYQLDRLEEQVKDLERTTTEQIVNITGNAELLVGTVVTYTTATNSGTVDIDGTVVPFANASSVRLEVDDVIILSANEAYPDPFAVGLYTRNGGPVGYDTYEFVVPSAVPGLPRDVTPMGANTTGSNELLTGVLRVIGNVAYAGTEQTNSLVAEDWDTPVRTSLALPAPFPTSSEIGEYDEFSFCINGSIIAVAGVLNGSTSSLLVNDGTVWNTHDYDWGSLARYPDNDTIYGAFGKKKVAGVWTSGTWLVEIDNTGAVTDTDLSATMSTLSTTGFIDAAGGHVVIGSQTQSKLYVDGTVHTYTYGGTGKLPDQGSSFKELQGIVTIYGDNMYFLFNVNGDPIANLATAGDPIGLGVMDLTSPTLATTSYNDIITATGDFEDGEPLYAATITVVNGTHVAIGGRVSYAYTDPTNYPTNSATRPCVWLYNLTANTVTAYVSNDSRVSSYAGDKGQTADGTYVNESQLTVGCEPGATKLIMLLDVYYRVKAGASTTYTNTQWLEGMDVV